MKPIISLKDIMIVSAIGGMLMGVIQSSSAILNIVLGALIMIAIYVVIALNRLIKKVNELSEKEDKSYLTDR